MALLQSGTRIYGHAIVDTSLSISGSNASTSNASGALKVSGGIGVVGNVFSSGNITALNANLGNIVVANYYTGVLTTVSQPNITSVGTLTQLSVSGNATITGNLTVNGTAFYANVITLNVKDPIIEQGGSPDGEPLVADDGVDRGQLLHYYDQVPIDAFMGWKNANSEFVFASNASLTDNTVTVNSLGNVRANAFIGNVIGTADTAKQVTEGTQSNITSVGTLTSLSVSGDITGTLATAAQPNITSLGNLTTLKVNGVSNLGPVGNVKITGGSAGDILKTDGTGNLSWIAAGTGSGNANIGGANSQLFFNDNDSTTLGASANLTFDKTTDTLSVTNLSTGNANLGNAVTANYFIGNGSMLTGMPVQETKAFFDSNIGNLVAGSAIEIETTYGNATYPAGVFRIYQMGPVTLGTTDIWASGAASKNQYANFLAGTVNTQNVSITFALANANFSIQSTDSITIGSTVITGANLTGLNITGNAGTYTVSSSLLSAGVQTAASSAVSANLTTTRGVFTSTGTTLTTVAPVAYTLNSVTGSFPVTSVPYWSLNQTFNWSASVTGTTASGNLTFSGGSVATTSLTSVGAASGTSISVDSTSSYIMTTNDYRGAGLNGYGTRTIPATVNGTVSAAAKYYPVFWKTTADSTVPTFTTSDSHNSNNYALGQGANTTSTTSNYTWIATPNATPHTWGYTFVGSVVGQDPAVAGTTTTISGQTYTIYGFTNFSAATFLYTLT